MIEPDCMTTQALVAAYKLGSEADPFVITAICMSSADTVLTGSNMAVRDDE
jgi:hypothetical protein